MAGNKMSTIKTIKGSTPTRKHTNVVVLNHPIEHLGILLDEHHKSVIFEQNQLKCTFHTSLGSQNGSFCIVHKLCLVVLAKGRSHSQIASITNTADESEWPAYLCDPLPLPLLRSSSPISELFLLYFNIWLLPSASVKTISCEIENNHVERDWAGSSLSSSPLLSMESWHWLKVYQTLNNHPQSILFGLFVDFLLISFFSFSAIPLCL